MSLKSRLSNYNILKLKPLPAFKEAKEFKEFNYENDENNSEDFLLFPCINILDDIVLKKINQKEEFENYKFFSNKVLQQETEHFPLVYFYDADKSIFSMEKFEGDFTKLNINEMETDDIMSFLLQILMALYKIDSYDKFHGDLNPGNVFYKKIEDDYSYHKGYLKYVIGEKTYFIKHFNKLWVVSDFEYMGKKGEILETSGKGFNTNFFKKIFCELYDKIKEPIKGRWLYDMYVLTYFIGAYTMSERIFNLYNEGCTLNPIDAIHFIIKNEISHIFICENL